MWSSGLALACLLSLHQLMLQTAADAVAVAATSAGDTDKPPAIARRLVVPYSPRVRFYSGDGRLVLAYSSDVRAGAAFVCQFVSGSGNSSSGLNYSISLLGASDSETASSVSIRGRWVQLNTGGSSAPRRCVLACTVSYGTSTGSQVTEWNLMAIDPLVKVANSQVLAKPDWLSDRTLTLTSATESPLRSENNTVTCQLPMSPGGMEFARLTLRQNGRRLQLLPGDLRFDWNSTDGDLLTQRVDATYRPDPDRAMDTFQCEASDPLRLITAAAILQVPHRAGLQRLHLTNSVTGEIITADSSVNETDSLACHADVAAPEVAFSWRVMRDSRLTAVTGRNISLKGVNLYFPICCLGENELDGRKFKTETCERMGGNSTFSTANAFDRYGRRQLALICDRWSTLDIAATRLSQLPCNAGLMKPGQDATGLRAHNCSTELCRSDTAMDEVKRNCKTLHGVCAIDATWLLDPFMMRTLKSRDAMPSECFATDGGVSRVEVDYICTPPSFVQFNATGVGASGSIQSHRLQRSGCYGIEALGASGGNYTCTRYQRPGTWGGGRGALKRGKFYFGRGVTLSVVVGQHGGNSSVTFDYRNSAAARYVGTGGGGGSFVYSGLVLYLAAGGGGGANCMEHGVSGKEGPNGSDSTGLTASERGRGGVSGSGGWTVADRSSNSGGSGSGWFSRGSRGSSLSQGSPGHGGPPSGSRSPFNGGVFSETPGVSEELANPGEFGGFGGGGCGGVGNSDSDSGSRGKGDFGTSGAGGGFSGGGPGVQDQAGGGGGSFCNGTLAEPLSCGGASGANPEPNGRVTLYYLGSRCSAAD